jgi:hypothetical protein
MSEYTKYYSEWLELEAIFGDRLRLSIHHFSNYVECRRPERGNYSFDSIKSMLLK